MKMVKIYKNNIGIEFRIGVGVDLTNATVTKYKVKKPSGLVVEWAATDYDATHLTYATVAGDLDEVGQYKLQAYIEIGPTTKIEGDTYLFKVNDQWT